MPCKVTVEFIDEVVILRLVCRLWILDIPLRDRVNELLATGTKKLVLNLENVDYVDSSGLGQLFSIYVSATKADCMLVLVHPTTRVAELLEITRLRPFFVIFQETNEAVNAAKNWTFAEFLKASHE
jgi:anti-sigma B factor antagonist